jgi:Tfp pilus assembly protein PilX
MNMNPRSTPRAVQMRGSSHRQKGIILVITLLCLVVMLISAIALLRATDASQAITGNLGFKRDLVNQGERGFQKAYAALGTGGALVSATTRQTNLASSNYSSCILPTDSNGIPKILEDTDANFANSTDASTTSPSCTSAVAVTANDIVDSVNGVTVRYVIDRLCMGTGTVASTSCMVNSLGYDTSGTQDESKPGGATPTAIYRISVRVSGPHNTLTFVQSTVTL